MPTSPVDDLTPGPSDSHCSVTNCGYMSKVYARLQYPDDASQTITMPMGDYTAGARRNHAPNDSSYFPQVAYPRQSMPQDGINQMRQSFLGTLPCPLNNESKESEPQVPKASSLRESQRKQSSRQSITKVPTRSNMGLKLYSTEMKRPRISEWFFTSLLTGGGSQSVTGLTSHIILDCQAWSYSLRH